MIEIFRKYSGVAFIVLIILFIGLIFMMDGVSQGGASSGPKVGEINGRMYSQSEVERKGSNFQRLLQDLVQDRYSVGNFTAYADIAPYAQTMQAGSPVDYLAKRLILKEAAQEYGIAPSNEQIEDYLKTTLFADKEGVFDQKGYSEFVTKRLPRLGVGVKALNELVSEILTLKKLMPLIGSGLSLNEELSKKAHQVQNQQITYQQFTFPLAKIKETIKPTEEELQDYWETNKNNYLTEPQKKISYVVSDANLIVKEAQYRAEQKEKARQEGKSEEELEEMTFDFPADRRTELIGRAGDRIDSLFMRLQDNEGKGLEEFAKEAEMTVKSTELFKSNGAPFEVKLPIYQGQGIVTDYVFNTPAATDSMESISDVLPIGEGRFLLFRVDGELLPEPLPYKETKARAKLDLIEERAENALEEETAKIRESLIEKVSEETPIETAAEELALTFTQREGVSLRDTLSGEDAAAELFLKASETPDGDFSDALLQPEAGMARAVIVRPLSRQYVKSEENQAALESHLTREPQLLENVLFENWMNNQVRLAGVKTVEE